MHSFDITMENISKIEGHTDLDVKVKGGKVEYVHLKIIESKRFYTQAIRGKPAVNAPHQMCRICGTCSLAHLICCCEACETAMGITPSEQTVLQRKLTLYGLHLRDHALHCYMFSLPDVMGRDSILEFDEKDEQEHQLIHDCFDVKAAGNALSTLVAGKAVHAPWPQVGGFLHIPDKDKMPEVIKKLKSVRPAILRLIDVFKDCKTDYTRKTTYVCMPNEDFNFCTGPVLKSSTGEEVPERDYLKHLEHVVRPYSQASGYNFEGETYLVGALARLNINKDALNDKTKSDAADALKLFPSDNVFHNNLAQAIEMLHCVDESIKLLEETEWKKEESDIKPKAGKGVGLVEAPRGVLYYLVETDDAGNVIDADIVVPTGQNQTNIELDIKDLVQNNLDKDKDFIQLEIEKLIRAYDPCMSCAAHFLKINWK